jgi:ABC-2 type transport system permease protein
MTLTIAAPRLARASSTQRTLALLWVLVSRELRLTWIVLLKEVRELFVSRALWGMVFISSLLVGFSFISAVNVYSESSANALKLPQLAPNQNPLDGIVIPVFAAVYLMNTFLFPFVAIRAISNEKQTGALKFALQLPVGIYRIVALKLVALFLGWSIALIPTLSAVLIWSFLLGGHLYAPEIGAVFLGHFLYALVIAGVAFLAAALTESAATAAIVALAFTLGSWILEFAASTGNGLVRAIDAFSLTPALRGLEQGLVGSPTAVTLAVLALGFLSLAVVWLPPGVSRREKLLKSGALVGIAFQALLLAIQVPIYSDVSQDQRNSFNPADARALGQMTKELKIEVNLASNDSHLRDLQRNVLTKLQRTAPHVTINYLESSTTSLLGGSSGANYGLVTYTYGGKQGTSRATTAREVLPLIEALDGRTVTPDPLRPYPGYPLITSADGAVIWFYAALPLLALLGWWFSQKPPALPTQLRSIQTHARFEWLRRAVVIGGACVVVIQFVPYGRDHAAIPVTAPATPLEAGHWCSANSSSMTLGALKQQVSAMLTQLDAAVSGLDAGDGGALASTYAQFTISYAGASPGLAQLYPVRCPRLLNDRIAADAAIASPRIDAGAAAAALIALESGISSIGTDLDQRIAQASPNGLVANQDQAFADAPFASGSPAWDSPTTQALATRTCAACHSNAPGWAWYTNLAPLSWVVQHNVDSGGTVLNLSEWDMPQSGSAMAAARVADGSMPPAWASLLDSRLVLSDSERLELARGLQTTFQLSSQRR